MYARAHNPSAWWHFVIAAGLAGLGVAGIVMGRRRAAAAAARPLPIEPVVSVPRVPITLATLVIPPTGPQGWYDKLMRLYPVAVENCIQEGVKGVEAVKQCAAKKLFLTSVWPPTGESKQWQWNVWANEQFNAYVQARAG